LKLAVILAAMLVLMLVVTMMLAVALCRCSIDEAHPTNTHHRPR
jgi:hypothetical protein